MKNQYIYGHRISIILLISIYMAIELVLFYLSVYIWP